MNLVAAGDARPMCGGIGDASPASEFGPLISASGRTAAIAEGISIRDGRSQSWTIGSPLGPSVAITSGQPQCSPQRGGERRPVLGHAPQDEQAEHLRRLPRGAEARLEVLPDDGTREAQKQSEKGADHG